jgi:two-component system sensor histidine kinase KdpD
MLVESLGGSYHQVIGDDVPHALIEFARAENATQLVLGSRHRGRLSTLLTGAGTAAAVTRLSGDIDVHIVTLAGPPPHGRLPGLPPGLPGRRRLWAALLAAVLLTVLTAVLDQMRGRLNLPSEMLLYMLAVVTVALVGGLYPAVGAAVAASLLINYYFTQPLYSFTVLRTDDVVALVVFVVVAALVSSAAEVAARRTREASRAAAEAQTLSMLAGSVLRGQASVPALLERLRETFALTSVTLLWRDDSASWPPRPGHGRRWAIMASAGEPACQSPAEADTEMPVGDAYVLALRGRVLPAADRRILAAFAAQAGAVIEQRRLAEAAEAAKPLAEADRVKAALLAAVSHELRTPLASAKAAVASLRGSDVSWTEHERAELLATADESLDSLGRLVANLLDMSRLQAGAASLAPAPVALAEVVPGALAELGAAGRSVRVGVPGDVPEVLADPLLLERVLANLVANAVRHSPPEQPPLVSASTLADRVELRVIDCGPGIREADRERMFAPFERLSLDDVPGLGLGLALSRGFAEAMGGSLVPEETPGGGLTMVLSLPVARASIPSRRAAQAREHPASGDGAQRR